MAEAVETIIVDAGQAGLSVSCHLTEAGQGHIVLERGAILETWRSQHWDSYSAGFFRRSKLRAACSLMPRSSSANFTMDPTLRPLSP